MRSLLVWVTVAAAVGIGCIVGYEAHQRTTAPDSGVEMCASMASGIRPAERVGVRPFTRTEYLRIRDVFQNSVHKDLRQSGVAFADAIWAFDAARERDSPEQYYGPLRDAYQSLKAACARQGHALPPLERQ